MENRIIAIGDTHGRDTWKKIVEQEIHVTKEIFIGDYWDSFDISYPNQLRNFMEILDYKRFNPERVVLLIGNHDFHYIPEMSEQYSGYQYEHAPAISTIFTNAIKDGLLQMCHEQDGFLFTHAGVTLPWCNKYEINPFQIQNDINGLFKHNPEAFKFHRLDGSGYGEHEEQSPIWVRPDSLIGNAIEGYTQVVGHTHQRGVQKKKNLFLIDTLDTEDEYLVIEDGKPQIRHVA